MKDSIMTEEVRYPEFVELRKGIDELGLRIGAVFAGVIAVWDLWILHSGAPILWPLG